MVRKTGLLAVLLGIVGFRLGAQSTTTSDSARVDFTGDGAPETWKLDTVGVAGDSLRITMSIRGSGKILYAESTLVARPTRAAALASLVRLDRHRLYALDTVPEKDWSVDEPWYDQARRTLIEREGLNSETATRVVDELKHGSRIALQSHIGTDLSLFRAWSGRLGRFVIIGRCC